jgi:hypothetical protein
VAITASLTAAIEAHIDLDTYQAVLDLEEAEQAEVIAEVEGR